jgi:hypothetical protein
MTLTSSAYAPPLKEAVLPLLFIVIPSIILDLFIFWSKGSMQMIKIAQLRASPCFTPLPILIALV